MDNVVGCTEPLLLTLLQKLTLLLPNLPLEEQQARFQNSQTVTLSRVGQGRVGKGLLLLWRHSGGCSLAGTEGAAAAWPGPIGPSPGVAIPWQICISLQAIKSEHKPVVLGLARMVQEQPWTVFAGMDLADTWKKFAEMCKKYAGVWPKYAFLVPNMQKPEKM